MLTLIESRPETQGTHHKIDSLGPGMDVSTSGTTESGKQVGKSGEWSIDSFLRGA
jgi:hypothetical protein